MNIYGLPFDEEDVNYEIKIMDKKERLSSLSPRMQKALDDAIEEICFEGGASIKRIEDTQKKIVSNILLSYENGVENYILEAPTGSGKSIIGILVINSIRNFKQIDQQVGYMLTNSKSLQDQLDNDTTWLKLENYQLLKGQSNYICHINGENFTKRECEDMGISSAEKKMKCAPDCHYILERRKAIESETAIFSYAYF